MIDPVAVGARREMLHSLLIDLKRPDHLYSSNFEGDIRPSVTVSALALQALSELQEPTADLVYRGIVNASADDPAGPWMAQGGGPPHTITAGWAVFAASRARLDAIHDMAPAVSWLLGLQDDKGGWPHVRGRPPRTFQTALVLNALLAYLDKLDFDLPQDATITKPRLIEAITAGIEYLIKYALSLVGQTEWMWDQRPKGKSVCLATTSLCLHVALKAASHEELQYLGAPACRSLAVLAGAFRQEILRQHHLTLPGVPAGVLLWPQIAENEPAYWYSYFTPLLALTFADAMRKDSSNAATYSAAIEECVRWTVYDYDPDGGDHNARGTWAVINALLVLRRASHVVAPTVAAGSSIVATLRDFGPQLTSDGDFAILCDSVDDSLISRITMPASQELMWRELLALIDSDAAKLLRLMWVVVERYPNSHVSKEISRWLSKD